MATIEERLAALEEKVQKLTTPPDDYYMSRWTGEQIDDAVAKINSADGLVTAFNGRSGAVMPQAGDYTAAMVGAAPAGFGLGNYNTEQPITANALSDFIGCGFYRIPGTSGIAPDASSNWWAIGFGTNAAYQSILANQGTMPLALRSCVNGVWGPWEWIDPPLLLGVEYRTTERYNGKPVYVMCGNGGAAPDNTLKLIYPNFGPSQNINVIDGRVFLKRDDGSSVLLPVSGMSTNNQNIHCNFIGSSFQVSTQSSVYATATMYYWIKYIKNSDS